MLKQSNFLKIQVAIPTENADEMRQAIGEAGAGIMGKYGHCSGSWKIIGRFTPLEGAEPAIGNKGKPEKVEEEIIQTICHKDVLKNLVEAIKKIHPYEEPPIDIMPRLEVE